MKQTVKSIKVQIRQEIAKEYKKVYEEKVNNLIERIKTLSELNNKLINDNSLLRERNEELEVKNNEFEDWIHRLQEYVNMPEEERFLTIENFRKKQHLEKSLNEHLSLFEPYFKLLNRFY